MSELAPPMTPGLLLRLVAAPTPEERAALAAAPFAVVGHVGPAPAGLKATLVPLDPNAPSHHHWAEITAAAPAAPVWLREGGERWLGLAPAVSGSRHVLVVRPEGAWAEVRALDLREGRPAFCPAPPGEIRPDRPDATPFHGLIVDAPPGPEDAPLPTIAEGGVAWALRGLAAARSGDLGGARAGLARAVELLGPSTHPWERRTLLDAACVLLELAAATGEGAEMSLGRALPLLERHGDCPELWFAAGTVMRALGSGPDALECFRNAARALGTPLDPFSAPDRLRRAPHWLFEAQAELAVAQGDAAAAGQFALAAVRARAAAEPAPPGLLQLALNAAAAAPTRQDEALVFARIATQPDFEPTLHAAVLTRLRTLRETSAARAVHLADVYAAASERVRWEHEFLRLRPTLVPVAAPASEPTRPTPAKRLQLVLGPSDPEGAVEALAAGLRALGHAVEIGAEARPWPPNGAVEALPHAVDLGQASMHLPGREVPRVVVAPLNAAAEGTALLLAALDRLRGAGVRFELRVLDGLPRVALLDELTEADVFAEGPLGPPSRRAHEALARGCAVLAGPGSAPEGHPAVVVTPDTLEAELRRVLTDRAVRATLARAGRTWVERNAAADRVAARLLAAHPPAGEPRDP
jgi:mRNA-degrading endonuclease toxin of MazEF toxin-antitoxin module